MRLSTSKADIVYLIGAAAILIGVSTLLTPESAVFWIVLITMIPSLHYATNRLRRNSAWGKEFSIIGSEQSEQ